MSYPTLLPALLLAAFPLAVRAAQESAGASEQEGAVAASPQEIRPILTGTRIPDAQIRDLEGELVSLREIVKAAPTILIFYRGGW